MRIGLKNDYRIDSDTIQFILKKLTGRKDKEGNDITIIVGFYSSLTQTLQAYIKNALLGSEATEVRQLVKELNELDKYVKDMLGGR